MSLNWREIELIVSELPLKGSRLQGVTQHDFNAISFHFFHPVHRQWTLYTEVGTPSSRLHKLTRARAKLPKTQRFVQFLKANLVNCLVSEVAQTPGERFVDLTCTRGEDTMHLLLRFYSGAGANIIVTDDSYTILDLLLRRPRRGEASGLSFALPEPKEIDDAFPIRRRTKESFNEQIEEEYAAERNIRTLESLYERATLL
ncbi:MAG TPA: NFACT family protein, partial [Sphaerochaeta sp.]|nr:NFACT family protein [Sphaerochaeta sp.]